MTTISDSPTIPIAPAVSRPRPTVQLRALVVRSLRKSVRNPELLTFSTLMPLAMLVLFSQVFRSIADGPAFPAGVSYIDYLTPAMIAVSTVMAATNAGVTAAIDRSTGIVDRFRSLPLARVAPLVAQTIADQLFTILRVAILGGAAALLLGFRLHGTLAESIAAFAVILPLGFAMGWLFVLIGAQLRDPAVVQSAGMMVMMPFLFISSAFAPLDTMPRWLQVAAQVNPVTHTIDAARAYALGQPDPTAARLAVAASIGMAAMAMVSMVATVDRTTS